MFRRNKKEKQTKLQNRGVTTRRSLPVDRYYSSSVSRPQLGGVDPAHSGRRSSSDKKRVRLPRVRRPASKIFSELAHWSSVIGILVVLVVNGTLGSVGIKVTTHGQSMPEFRSEQEYRAVVDSAFRSSLFYKTKATFRSADFESELLKQFPEADRVVAVVPLVGTKLQVGIELAKPLLRVERGGVRQGVIGENGTLLLEEDITRVAGTYSALPLLKLEPQVSFSPGEQALTSQEVELIRLLQKEFDGSESHRPSVASLRYHIQKRELEVTFEGAPYKAKLTSAREARVQVGALVASVEKLAEQGTLPSGYIDVRADGRVFTK